MNALAVLVTGYFMAILVGRLKIRSRWVKYAGAIVIAILQVGLVVHLLSQKEPPSLERP